MSMGARMRIRLCMSGSSSICISMHPSSRRGNMRLSPRRCQCLLARRRCLCRGRPARRVAPKDGLDGGSGRSLSIDGITLLAMLGVSAGTGTGASCMLAVVRRGIAVGMAAAASRLCPRCSNRLGSRLGRAASASASVAASANARAHGSRRGATSA